MCYAAPGPRCSAHAAKDLAKAQAVYGAAEEAFNQATQTLAAKVGHDPTFEERMADKDWKKVWTAKRAADDALQAAQDVYDTTPAGIQALKDEATQIEDQYGPMIPGVNVDPADAIAQVFGRLDHAQATRAAQLAAYKDSRKTTNTPDMADAPEDEAAAAAPRPLCTCIDYKYKQACPHVNGLTSQVTAAVSLTGHQASMAVHEATSRFRTMKTDLAAHRSRIIDAGGDPQADRAYRTELMKVQLQAAEVNRSMERFATTPAGTAYLHRAADRSEARTGYNQGESSGLREAAKRGQEDRTSAVEAYERVTGKAAPTDDTTTPPDLPYGNGCGTKCDDFSWTGTCSHVDPDVAEREKTAAALANALGGSDYGKALRRELGAGPKPKGLLGRLRDRLSA